MANGNGGGNGVQSRDMSAANAAQATGQEFAAAAAYQVGRYQGPEFLEQGTVSFAAPAEVTLTTPIPLNRPLADLLILLRFRATLANNDYVSIAPEAPQSILNRVLLQGTHTRYGQQNPIEMAGASVFMFPRLFSQEGGSVLINGVRAANPGLPFVSPWLGTVAGSTYDIEVVYRVPMRPVMGPGMSSKFQDVNYVLQPAEWGNTLRLRLGFGDETSFGVPTTAGDLTFTAFGSTSGLPSWEVHCNYALNGAFAGREVPGVFIRNERVLQLVTAAQNLQMAILQKSITTNMIIKAGTAQAASAGVNVYGTLVDTQLERTRIVIDTNKPIRNNERNRVTKEYYQQMFGTVVPAGYFVESFVDSQNAQNAFRGDLLPGGSNFELRTDVLTTGATQQQHVIQEMIYGGPFPSSR